MTQQAYTFEKEIHIVKQARLRYLLYLPEDYDSTPGRRWPLILFLHGAGERGSDLNLVKLHGPPKLIEQGRRFPFIVVSPQCSRHSWWPVEVEALNALLDEIMASYAVDPKRVYLTGLSMGGFGTWALAAAYPGRFAAIAPICGGGDPETACALKNTPTWVFHGARDQTVPLSESKQMVDAVLACGGPVEPRLTVYPEAEHDSWTKTYNNSRLYDWFLQNALGD
ncbi:MAG: prolyl oligopeptidase family serine peptidase [Anaerolineae bacterium]|nr:prolyl oligopeptidase family serine peptidase [Anaerolineae bacterium]